MPRWPKNSWNQTPAPGSLREHCPRPVKSTYRGGNQLRIAEVSLPDVCMASDDTLSRGLADVS
jgi:hypothetical protein